MLAPRLPACGELTVTLCRHSPCGSAPGGWSFAREPWWWTPAMLEALHPRRPHTSASHGPELCSGSRHLTLPSGHPTPRNDVKDGRAVEDATLKLTVLVTWHLPWHRGHSGLARCPPAPGPRLGAAGSSEKEGLGLTGARGEAAPGRGLLAGGRCRDAQFWAALGRGHCLVGTKQDVERK